MSYGRSLAPLVRLGLVLAALLFGAFTHVATAAPPLKVALRTTAVAPGDTFRIVASWAAVNDGQTPPASYTVAWRTQKYPIVTAFPTVGPTKTITTTTDSLSIAMPAFPDSMWVEVKVTATRSGANAAPTIATKFFRKPNPQPPPVGAITLDTAGVH